LLNGKHPYIRKAIRSAIRIWVSGTSSVGGAQ
jgi:hypothetical protein